MGMTWQVFSVSAERLEVLRSDPEALSGLLDAHYGDDVVDGEVGAVWLDKSGMGILEAFGVIDESADPPQAWVLGSEETTGVGEPPCPVLSVEQTAEVAEWISSVTDANFAERAASNLIDTDVDYLAHWFPKLRDFYARAAEQGRATMTRIG